MKTKFLNQTQSWIAFLLTVMVLSLSGCSSEIPIVEGPRVFYDFNKKQLFEDAAYKMPLNRPLVMKETSKIQVEMKNYNPLNYDIVTEDTSYDRFEPNVEYFNKLINYPSVKIDPPVVAQSEEEKDDKSNENPKTDCEKLTDELNRLSIINRELNDGIDNYQRYISNMENILSFYNYLKSLDVITKDEVVLGIKSNIIDPINKELKDCKLDTLPKIALKENFKNIEEDYYKKVINIGTKLTSSISTVSRLKKSKNCKDDFDSNKAKFDKDSKAILAAIDEFKVAKANIIDKKLPNVMLVYEKLLRLAQADPFSVTKSYYINKDIHTINIFKYNPDTKSKQEHDAIMIQLTDGFRIDVAGGFFFSGLYDEKYTTLKKDLIFTTKYIHNGRVRDTLQQANFTALYETRNSKISFGGMVFLQGHTQNASLFNWGGYIGLGTMFNDQARWAGSFGISFIYGRSQRFSVNIGPIMSQVDRLDSPYRTNYFYQNNFEKMPVSRVWVSSMMIGCSWKIGK